MCRTVASTRDFGPRNGGSIPPASTNLNSLNKHCGMVQRLNIFVFETKDTGSSPVAATILIIQ